MKHKEIDELVSITKQLEAVELPTLSRAARLRIEEATFRPSKTPRIIAFSLAGSFAVLAVVIVSAQSAQPGSPLYVVKNTTDNINAFFFPKEETSKSPIATPEAKSLEQPKLKEVNGSSIVTEPTQLPKQPSDDSKTQQKSSSKHEDKKSDRRDDNRKSRDKSDRSQSDNWFSNRFEDFWRR